MVEGRHDQKAKMKSNKGKRHSLAERHRLGISTTAIAAAKRAAKAAKQNKK